MTARSFEQVLASRRMCRDFLDRPIPDDVLDPVLRAAFRGPAAGNTSALDLVVLRGERVAVIDSSLRVPDRIAAVASVLAGEELNGVYLPPAVRKRLDASRPLRVRPGEAWAEMAPDPEDEDGADPEADAV